MYRPFLGVSDLLLHKNILSQDRVLFKKPFAILQRLVIGKPQLQNVASYSSTGSHIRNGIKPVHRTNSMPLPKYKTKDHSFTWITERVVTVCLIGILPATVFDVTHAIEGSTCTFLMAHLYWGLEAICTDYLRPSVVGNLIPKLIPVIVGVPLLFTLYGLIHLMLSEKGFFHVIKRFWFLKTTEELLISNC